MVRTKTERDNQWAERESDNRKKQSQSIGSKRVSISRQEETVPAKIRKQGSQLLGRMGLRQKQSQPMVREREITKVKEKESCQQKEKGIWLMMYQYNVRDQLKSSPGSQIFIRRLSPGVQSIKSGGGHLSIPLLRLHITTCFIVYLLGEYTDIMLICIDSVKLLFDAYFF